MARRSNMSSATHSSPNSRRRFNRRRFRLVVAMLLVVAGAVAYNLLNPVRPQLPGAIVTPQPLPTRAEAGKVLWRGEPVTLTPPQVEATSHQNFAGATPKAQYSVTRTLVRYRSYDLDNTPITLYARIYQPVGRAGAPLFGFASGTTGIGDQCAPSIENPRKANWANYESHLVTYAGQGYATVITDYEGMRDDGRIHHYMVGELEGRAVLDSLRAMINLNTKTNALDPAKLFVGGYSQGGHSAFWADQIAGSYAPELKVKGVVGFGPVMDVQQTWSDILRAANINWFGPYVLTSYADYYHDNYDINRILLPRYGQNLRQDVLSHCIDTNLIYWANHPSQVYTPEFLASLAGGLNDPADAQLRARLEANQVGSAPTKSAKLINEGAHDNVVLPAQQTVAMERLCANSKGAAQLKVYAAANHYNTMVLSFHDTLAWMEEVMASRPVPTTCK